MKKQTTPTYGDKIALAASSLSALALLPAGAEAGIVYFNTALGPVTSTTDTTWNVDGAGSAEFRFKGFNTPAVALNSDGLNGLGLVQKTTHWRSQFQNLPLNFVVGPTLAAGYQVGAYNQPARCLAVIDGFGPRVCSTAADFVSDTPGYFGFKFTDGTNLFYGWAELTIDAANTQYTINRWAYNDTPDGSICVGQTSGAACGAASTVPEPGTLSLALLGLGAGGLRAWRKRKAQQALVA